MKPFQVYVGCPIQPEAEQALASFCDFEKWTGPGDLPQEVLLAKAADLDGLLFDGGQRVTRSLLEQAPRLRAVSNASVGYNNFDLPAMKDHQIIGTNASGTLDDTVADLAMGLILCTGRRIAELDQLVKSGQWLPGDDTYLFGIDAHHKTLGIIGLGRIGEAVVQRAKFGFNMDVLYYNRRRKPEAEDRLGVVYATLDDLLARSDYVVMIIPYSPESHHMIGTAQFALMKKTAFFINVSRGKNIDEQALITALQNGTIAGAGLDVYEQEPIALDNPLLKLKNVVTVPHIGSATAETRLKMVMTAVENLRQALNGIKPELTVPELK